MINRKAIDTLKVHHYPHTAYIAVAHKSASHRSELVHGIFAALQDY